MRFQRTPRFGDYVWSRRKEAAYLRRHERIAKRIERDIPLFAGQYVPEPETDVEAEKARRQRMAAASEQSIRDLEAKHWRKGRAAYFACAPEIRAQITAEWNAWTGPLKAGYFIYVVEKHSGEAERRRQFYEAERRTQVERIFRSLGAQGDLPL
ncbi:conserved protein of unknown function (plasmid) [Paraburkholderia kururiensis]|uniref:hypothetical protein n=1 Tax=Paraburkholderia kururiensis TaxID=984307 RepID=UPI0039A55F0F